LHRRTFVKAAEDAFFQGKESRQTDSNIKKGKRAGTPKKNKADSWRKPDRFPHHRVEREREAKKRFPNDRGKIGKEARAMGQVNHRPGPAQGSDSAQADLRGQMGREFLMHKPLNIAKPTNSDTAAIN